jgi:uncharacterized membrane protein
MKKVIMIAVTLALVAVSGCYSSSDKGGSALKDEGFKIAVPTFGTEIKQGEVQNVTISLERGVYFRQDVRLLIKTTKGISVNPSDVLVKAGDIADVQLRIEAAKGAALGEYSVSVKGTPTAGSPTSTEFTVKVIAPEDAGYTMQSDSPKGGSVLKGKGFKIAVPTFDTKIKQGEVQSVTLSLERGESFKQDVMLKIKLSKGEGIALDPAKIFVKASDKPDVQLTITVPKDAAFGEYIVSVTGTPKIGEPTSTEFNVRVVPQ